MLPTLALAAWQWFPRPYEARPDPRATCRIESAELRRDFSYHWLDLNLRVIDPENFRIEENLALITASGREIPPSGLTLGGEGMVNPDPRSPVLAAPEVLGIKFWLDPGDLDGPLALRMAGASLQVRNGSTPPDLRDAGARTYRNCHW